VTSCALAVEIRAFACRAVRVALFTGKRGRVAIEVLGAVRITYVGLRQEEGSCAALSTDHEEVSVVVAQSTVARTSIADKSPDVLGVVHRAG
jgi:hypothetical protein